MIGKDKKNKLGDKKKELAKRLSSPKKRAIEEEVKLDFEDTEDDIETALKESSLSKKQAQKRKRNFKYGLVLGVVGLLGLLLYWGLKPFKSSMAYGICKVFAELYVQYPTTIRYSEVEENEKSVRVWFTYTDSFGEYRLESIACFFRQDEKQGTILDYVTIARREIPSEEVKLFNKSIPVILRYPPDITMPRPLPDNLKNLQFEKNRFIKPIFD